MLRPFPVAARNLPIHLSLVGLISVMALCPGILPAAAKAQQAKPSVPSTSPVRLLPAPPISPQVQPDGTTVFRLAMPNAVAVKLELEGAAHPFPMTKGPDGVWTVTIPKLAPEYYGYTFNVDGTGVLDPHNETVKTSFFSTQNVFLVPGQPSMPWEPENVPHGVVHHRFYRSNIVGIDSEYYVYTPPNFDPKSNRKYPVLYLLHGYSDKPSAWTRMGKANVMLDNLIAQGKVKPMIVVMPWGYGNMQMISHGWAAWRDPQLVHSNYSRFSDALFQEVMPLVQRQYPLSDKREDHAIAGLSMGGAESLLVGLNHTDYFAYVGGFSAGSLGDGNYAAAFPGITPQSATQIDDKLRLLWIACGMEDGLLAPNQHFIAWLQQQGLHPTVIQTPGRHVWMVWRNNFSKFAPLLFQAKQQRPNYFFNRRSAIRAALYPHMPCTLPPGGVEDEQR
ncbi:MAG: esterase [Acidobacteriaceae bacterium]